jgi:hypothetical protein
MRRSLLIPPLPALALTAPAAAAENPWLSARVLTARPIAFEKLLRSHPAPEACG